MKKGEWENTDSFVATERKPSTGLKPVLDDEPVSLAICRDGEKTQHGIETDTEAVIEVCRCVATERKPSTGLKRIEDWT